MTLYVVQAFGGMAPAIDERLLSDSAAELAINSWLDVGNLTGFLAPKPLYTAPIPSLGYVYRIPNNYDEPNNFTPLDESGAGGSHYMYFSNPDTTVVRGSVFGDTFDRYYWASTSDPPKYNTRDRIFDITVSTPPFLLGIPTPPIAPTLTVTGGTSITVSRAYIVTFLSAYDEEGPPSPAALGTGFIDATWALTAIPVPSLADRGTNRNITKKRIYRTITGTTGVATFFLVDEIDATVTSYTDIKEDEEIVGNNILASDLWSAPPEDLEGFVMGQNGILAGWRGNEIWFSEPYRPHAWPVPYVLTTEYPIVGIAVISSTFYVLTRGYPVTISGTSPLSLTISRVPIFEPCTSRGGIVTCPEGVYYPSGNGLILLQPGAVTNISKTIITKERWQFYTEQANFRAGRLGSVYYGYGTVQFGAFQENAFQDDAFTMGDNSGAMDGIFIDPTNQRMALILLHSKGTAVSNVLNDPWSSELFIIKGSTVYWLDLSDPDQVTEPATWHSKTWGMAWPRTLGAAKIYFDVPAMTPELGPVRNTDQSQTKLADDQYILVNWFGDEKLIATHEVRKSGELLRLPSSSKYEDFRFEIQTRVEINSIHFASNPKELRGI